MWISRARGRVEQAQKPCVRVGGIVQGGRTNPAAIERPVVERIAAEVHEQGALDADQSGVFECAQFVVAEIEPSVRVDVEQIVDLLNHVA